MSTAFVDVRRSGSRVPIVAGVVLWLAALATSVGVGIATGLALFIVAIPLGPLAQAFDFDIVGAAFTIGWLAPIALVVVGVPLSAVFADRLGPWVVGATLPDPTDARHQRIVDAMASVGLANGIEPLLLLVDADWVDVAMPAKRGNRYVVVTTTAAASLPGRQLEMLAATALADSVAGAGAARVRLASQMPALLPIALALRLWRWANASPRVFFRAVLAVMGAALVGMVAYPGVDKSGLTIVLAIPAIVLLLAMFGALIAGCAVIAVVWLALLTVLALPITRRATALGDVGALSLVRDPEAWRDFMLVAPQRSPLPPAYVRRALSTTLPATAHEAQTRIAAVARTVPGAAHSLAPAAHPQQPPPSS